MSEKVISEIRTSTGLDLMKSIAPLISSATYTTFKKSKSDRKVLKPHLTTGCGSINSRLIIIRGKLFF
jgi:hypothetical protein